MDEPIRVEVVAGHADEQVLISLELPLGSTVADAVRAANLSQRLPTLSFDGKAVGIFGRRCKPEQVLCSGDRVEVYQPLKADPKVVRRELAEIERAKKRPRAS